MSAVFRGIHSWTVFRDRLTGRGLGEFPGAWLNFTKFPIEVLTYGTVWMDLRARQKHAIRGNEELISFGKVKLPFNVSCLIYRRVKSS